MNQRLRLRAFAFLALLLATAAGFLAAPAAAATAAPEEVAAAYLRARAAAVASARPSRVLAPYVVAGSALAAREALVARGAALRQADLGHGLDRVGCDVTILDVSPQPRADTVVIGARAVVTQAWHARGALDQQASGVDHLLTLKRRGGAWRVTADAYVDVELPALLERAGATAARVRAAARRLETAAAAAHAAHARTGWDIAAAPPAASGAHQAIPPGGAGLQPAARGYVDRLVYDREAVRAYADKYALGYNPTYMRFSGDCCNFVSQSAFAGGMPVSLGDWTTGWWYGKNGTSSPSDDSWSWSWISCSKQIAFWLGTRIDWVSSISSVGKGDVVYYDWTGDGLIDHVAVLVGTNAAGQKVIDAHTTDHCRAYWKLGSSSTRYKFGRVRAYWVI